MARKKESSEPDAPAQPGGSEKSFEVVLKELEGIVEALDGGEKPLEESLELYERGIKALRACQKVLESAEARMRLLIEKDGKPALRDAPAHDVQGADGGTASGGNSGGD